MNYYFIYYKFCCVHLKRGNGTQTDQFHCVLCEKVFLGLFFWFLKTFAILPAVFQPGLSDGMWQQTDFTQTACRTGAGCKSHT